MRALRRCLVAAEANECGTYKRIRKKRVSLFGVGSEDSVYTYINLEGGYCPSIGALLHL